MYIYFGCGKEVLKSYFDGAISDMGVISSPNGSLTTAADLFGKSGGFCNAFAVVSGPPSIWRILKNAYIQRHTQRRLISVSRRFDKVCRISEKYLNYRRSGVIECSSTQEGKRHTQNACNRVQRPEDLAILVVSPSIIVITAVVAFAVASSAAQIHPHTLAHVFFPRFSRKKGARI